VHTPSRPLLVLVHGANHQGVCWDPTVAALGDRVPDGQVLAVDLPGRGGDTTDVASISIGRCVDSVLRQIDEVTDGDVVLVGHSLGGVVITGAATALGHRRVQHLVFVAATIPAEGGAVLDTLGLVPRLTVPLAARRRKLSRYPRRAAVRAFCNGMDATQRSFVLEQLCPDASWLVTEPVHRATLSPAIDRTWVLTTEDRAVPAERQRRNIENLGGVNRIIEIASGHDVMVREPAALADALASCWALPVR